MIIEYIKLYFIFFKVGLFTIGGGLAAIPLLQDEILNRGWLTVAQFADMIAVIAVMKQRRTACTVGQFLPQGEHPCPRTSSSVSIFFCAGIVRAIARALRRDQRSVRRVDRTTCQTEEAWKGDEHRSLDAGLKIS